MSKLSIRPLTPAEIKKYAPMSATHRYCEVLEDGTIWNAPVMGPGPTVASPPGRRLLATLSSAERKEYPVARGVLDYFPDAIALVARLSWAGNEKHNPGEPLHWARSKGGDNPDCVARHLIERDGSDVIELQDGRRIEIPHRVAMAWRALAELQLWAEEEYQLSMAPGATP
jgi:hypothetical protein